MGAAKALTLLVLAALVSSQLGCGKKKTALRDPHGLPHVDRPYPKVTSDVQFEYAGLSGIQKCMQDALDRDPTEAGTMTLLIHHGASGVTFSASVMTGKLDQPLRLCVEADQPVVTVEAGREVTATLTFSSEMQHEALAPGWTAVDQVVRRRLRSDPLKIVSTRVTDNFFDAFQDGKRQRSCNIEAVVELTESGLFADCATIQDFGQREGMNSECHKKRHIVGDQLTLSGYEMFELDGDNGWRDASGRHWFGDEIREVE